MYSAAPAAHCGTLCHTSHTHPFAFASTPLPLGLSAVGGWAQATQLLRLLRGPHSLLAGQRVPLATLHLLLRLLQSVPFSAAAAGIDLASVTIEGNDAPSGSSGPLRGAAALWEDPASAAPDGSEDCCTLLDGLLAVRVL